MFSSDRFGEARRRRTTPARSGRGFSEYRSAAEGFAPFADEAIETSPLKTLAWKLQRLFNPACQLLFVERFTLMDIKIAHAFNF